MSTTIEITIRRLPDASLVADLRVYLPNSRADLGGAPVTISAEALRGLASLPDAYGAALTAMGLPPALHPAWAKVRGHAEGAGQGLHVRVAIEDPSGALHALRWELLRDPITQQPLATQEGGSLARLIVVADLHDAAPPPRPALRALLAVAGPADAARWSLAPVDVAAEAGRALDALGTTPADLLAHGHPQSSGRATLASLRHGLRKPAHILYLIAHGKATDAGTVLYLEGDDGNAAPITGADLAEAIGALAPKHRPLLAVLVACEGADQAAAPLASVGPLLARAGVPAVIAMQTQVSMAAAARFTARLLRELERDGRIDRALAAARAEMGDEWWAPVLWLRIRDGRLWAGDDARTVARRQRLALARSRHSQERFAELRQGFVGREAELAAIRREVDALRATGGYLLVTGVAGQGKSSVLAALIATRGPETTPAYFIRFSPGMDEQVALLRHLVAELLIQHGLEELADGYLPETAIKDTLANSLAMVLDRISQAGQPATLVIDGLDQIRPDRQMGERDLSFLPEKLPAGVVILIGTRPDDTLKPLKVLASQREYKLPPLSLDDFAALLTARGAALATHERQALYDALHGNAFDLAFVVREIAATADADVPALLERVKQNPQDIFTPALDRLKGETLWRRAIRPILGCLLAAAGSEPLSEDALGAIINLDTDEVSEAILRLRGFLGEIDRNGRAYSYLYHLKLIDYLRGAQVAAGTRIFSVRDVEQYHGRIVAWCEAGGLEIIWQDAPDNALEQERRGYARQHYTAHLAAARAYDRLWEVIDGGEYGAAKRRHDPSTRSYALDLDIARQAVVDAAAGDADAQAWGLPRLWKYSLLRCSLTSQVDNYPEELFLALVALGRSGEAINLAELLSDPLEKANTLRAIGVALIQCNDPTGVTVLQDTRWIVTTIADEVLRDDALKTLTTTLADARLWEIARQTADTITDEFQRDSALLGLATKQAQAQCWNLARQNTDAIADKTRRAFALITLVRTLGDAHLWEEARQIIDTIAKEWQDHALHTLAESLMRANIWDRVYQTIDAITRAGLRAKAFGILTITLAEAGDTVAARQAADAIPDDGERAQALANLALTLAHARELSAARITFRDAWNITVGISNSQQATTAFSMLAHALIQAQIWDMAFQAIDAITDRILQVKALGALSLTLGQTGDISQARHVVDTISDAETRANILSKMAQNSAQAGDQSAAISLFNEADQTIAAIHDPVEQVRSFNILAQALIQAQFWAIALQTINRITVEQVRFGTLITLAQALNQAGDIAATYSIFTIARQTVDMMPDQKQRAESMIVLTQALAQAGDISAALDTLANARRVIESTSKSDEWRYVLSLSILAQAIMLAGDTPTALTIFTNAHLIADTFSSELARDAALRALAQHLAAAHQWERASQTAHSIDSVLQRSNALYGISHFLTQERLWSDARQTINTIPIEELRSKALLALAQHIAQTDDATAALDVFTAAYEDAEAIPELWAPCFALGIIAQTQFLVGDMPTALAIFAESRSMADTIPDTQQRAQALYHLSDALAYAKCWESARTTVSAIPDELQRIDALISLAQTLDKHGNTSTALATFTDARQSLDAIFDENALPHLVAMSNLANALAQARLWDMARQTAEMISVGWLYADTLHSIASTLAQSGELRQYLALLTDHWRRAQTRDELLRLFVVPTELIRAYPELGREFLNSFAWVDAQIAAA